MKCPECNSTHIRENGVKKGKQNHICVDCRRQFVVLTVESPSPVPLPSSLVVKNGSKIRSKTSGVIPVPVSEMVTLPANCLVLVSR
jgi:transposase-like protein